MPLSQRFFRSLLLPSGMIDSKHVERQACKTHGLLNVCCQQEPLVQLVELSTQVNFPTKGRLVKDTVKSKVVNTPFRNLSIRSVEKCLINVALLRF